MANEYKIAVVMSGLLNDNGSLHPTTQIRVDRAIELQKQGYQRTGVKSLLMSGGHANLDAPISHAEAMIKYVLQQGLEDHVLGWEKGGLETVGELIITKLGIIVPENIGDFIIVSEKAHLERIQEINKLVYGNDFKIEYVGVGNYPRQEEGKTELKKLAKFYETFKGIDKVPLSQRDQTFLEMLCEKHPYYNGQGRYNRKKYPKLGPDDINNLERRAKIIRVPPVLIINKKDVGEGI